MGSSNPTASGKSGAGDDLSLVSPDFVEQDLPETIDNVVPTSGYQMTSMVGLGGSAGSISALTTFFKEMPPDSGMVFVVVLHLSPTHGSTLTEVLSRSTKMTVLEAEDGLKVEPNHVYVIPPGKLISTVNRCLRLTDLEHERGRRVAVDFFFRSLADTHGPHAAAVVLSGADGDGAVGIKRIKERGGLTIAQDPDEAEYSGMPRSSIDTGMIDWVLRVAQIPERLLAYRENGERLRLPPEDGPALAPPMALKDGEEALQDVLTFLQTRTGRDFSYYKRATILRRIARRMQVNGVDNLSAYNDYLRTHPGESGALLQDLLISVTNFFRDREVFEAMKHHISELFKGKTPSDSVRVWVPACATGEEAYSLAILLLEESRTINHAPALQVFACDLDDEAIRVARAGYYPDSIMADVSEERLRNHFVKEKKGYRVRRELREMVLFASHDLLKNAPFSRMDLISCRNLLIYLNRNAQQRAFEIFHFAMRPNGRLLLGASEAVDDDSPLFRVLDKKHRIYAKLPAGRTELPIPIGPSSLLRIVEAQRETVATPMVHGKRFAQDAALPFRGQVGAGLDRASLAELHFRLIERYSSPSIIVNAEHEILHLSEHAGSFLKFTGGEPTTNLLRLAHPALRVELRAALFRAAESHSPVEAFGVPVDIDGQSLTVNIRVAPAEDIAPGVMLVVFDRCSGPSGPTSAVWQNSTPESAAPHLEREVEQIKSHLRDTVEQYETSTEELKASNEELQAMNEELRSATEELETGREELQSINEELGAVNLEMKNKVDELAQANSDLQNLMASTAIPTLFLDRNLAIARYTPSAVDIFNLIPSDIGRPLAHMRHRIDYPGLIADAQRVLQTLVPVESEVHDDSHWYLARLQPYRTPENRIAGVVLTLVDVTERNRATQALQESEERMRALIVSAKDYAIFTTDRDRRVDSWNPGAETMFGYSEREIIGQPADILFTPEDRARGEVEREMRLASTQERAANERWHVRKDGSTFYGSGSVTPLRDKAGGVRGFVKIMRDLTETKHAQEILREQMDELTRFNAAAVGRETRMIELKKEINELCIRCGQAPRYAVEAERADEGKQ